jgi:hypothetical protein
LLGRENKRGTACPSDFHSLGAAAPLSVREGVLYPYLNRKGNKKSAFPTEEAVPRSEIVEVDANIEIVFDICNKTEKYLFENNFIITLYFFPANEPIEIIAKNERIRSVHPDEQAKQLDKKIDVLLLNH